VAEIPSLVELIVDVNDRLASGLVDHAFGGALALAYYVDRPRATRDLDINVRVPVAEAERVFALLPASVKWARGDVVRTVADGQVRLWAGPPRQGIPVDLFFPQHAFHEAVADGASDRPFGRSGYSIPVIAADHLAVFKSLFDRPKDWVDIGSMLQAGTVDPAEVSRWLRVIVGEDHPVTERFRSLVADVATGSWSRPDGGADRSAFDWRAIDR
jgi:hypothetical protein